MSWELEGPSSAPPLRVVGAGLPIIGDPGKWQGAKRESEGAVESDDGKDNTTSPEEGPLLHRVHDEKREGAGQCPIPG